MDNDPPPKVSPGSRLLGTLKAVAPPEMPPVNALELELALEAMADATKEATSSDLECYAGWCVEQNLCPVPANPENIVLYLRHLEAVGRKPSTLKRRVASIASVHRLLGFAEKGSTPTSHPMVQNALRSNRRRHGGGQRQAAPLRLGGALNDDVQGLTISTMLEACSTDLPGLRDAALLSVGYDSGVRVSELTAIEVDQMHLQSDGDGLLFIPRSKTDQENEGEWAWLSKETMRRVKAWLDAARIKKGFLFRKVGVDARNMPKGGSPRYLIGQTQLTRQGVSGIYRKIARHTFNKGLVILPNEDIEPWVRSVSTHSTRVGLTQDLFANGADGVTIALALRWKSSATALRYGRALAAKHNAASRMLSSIRK